jgi:hypothetical protein
VIGSLLRSIRPKQVNARRRYPPTISWLRSATLLSSDPASESVPVSMLVELQPRPGRTAHAVADPRRRLNLAASAFLLDFTHD